MVETQLESAPDSVTTPTPPSPGEARLSSFQKCVGRRYASATLRNFETAGNDSAKHAIDRVRRYGDCIKNALQNGTNLLLIGPPGTGKDHLLCGLAQDLIPRGLPIRWVNGVDLYAKFRDAIDLRQPEQGLVDDHAKPAVLILSDPMPPLGGVTDRQREILFRIIDRRYRDQRPTWATLNAKDGDEVAERLSPNIADRLADGAVIVPCNWPSYRKPQ